MFKRDTKNNNTAKKKGKLPIIIGVLLLLALIGNLGDNNSQKESSDDVSNNGTAIEAEDNEVNSSTEDFSKSFEALEITARTNTLEYSDKEIDPLSLIKISSPEFDIFAENSIDLSKVGKQTVTYIAENGEDTRTFYIEYEIKDTKFPLLSLANSDLKLELGTEYNLQDNIIFAKDSVDGDLPYLESPSDNEEGFWVSGTLDVNTLGYYPIMVSALDRNGNLTEKEFSITVIQPEIKSAPEEEAQDSTSSNSVVENDSKADDSNAGNTENESTEPVFTYILNTNRMKFHYPGCRDVNKMKESNKKEVQATRSEVLSWGYEPCGHCHP